MVSNKPSENNWFKTCGAGGINGSNRIRLESANSNLTQAKPQVDAYAYDWCGVEAICGWRPLPYKLSVLWCGRIDLVVPAWLMTIHDT